MKISGKVGLVLLVGLGVWLWSQSKKTVADTQAEKAAQAAVSAIPKPAGVNVTPVVTNFVDTLSAVAKETGYTDTATLIAVANTGAQIPVVTNPVAFSPYNYAYYVGAFMIVTPDPAYADYNAGKITWAQVQQVIALQNYCNAFQMQFTGMMAPL